MSEQDRTACPDCRGRGYTETLTGGRQRCTCTYAHEMTPAAIVGEPVITRLRLAGYAVVPFDVPPYAVGEVMEWTGCKSPDMAWEAINCALNMMVGPEHYRPEKLAELTLLGGADRD